jgi:hypothetical protein
MQVARQGSIKGACLWFGVVTDVPTSKQISGLDGRDPGGPGAGCDILEAR